MTLLKTEVSFINIEKQGEESMERKEFKTTGVSKTGTSEDVTVFFGMMRGNTTWFAKNTRGVSCKITKSKKGVFTYGTGKYKFEISDENVTGYIGKDL